jgi:hypothetical protein
VAAVGQGARSVFDANLVRRCLHYAWHLARTAPAAARIALGAGPDALAAMAGCRLARLDAIAEECPDWVRPRWPERLQWWQALFASATLESPATLERLQLWGLQALAAAASQPAAAPRRHG